MINNQVEQKIDYTKLRSRSRAGLNGAGTLQETKRTDNGLERFVHGLRLLFLTMRPRYSELALPEIRRTPEGYEYQVYHPRGKAIRTVILVYGMSIEGEEDGRLIKFARSCVENGLRVVVPHLPGLMGFVVEQEDMRRLAGIVRDVAPGEKEKIGLVGFSTGGSYSLLLAAQSALSEWIGPVVLFSPIYDVRDVSERLHAPVELPKTDKDWDQFLWAQYVIALRNRSQLGLAEEVQDALQILLADYDGYSVAVKRAFYDEHVQPLKLMERSDLFNEGETLDLLSARGQLAGVKSPVFIMHDASDQIVPPLHSRQMHAELTRRGAGFRQSVLVTPWLAHVVMQTTGSPFELFQIISFLGELFRFTE